MGGDRVVSPFFGHLETRSARCGITSSMRFVTSIFSLLAAASIAGAQSKVDFGMMTWPEVKAALAAGKTTALIYNGGTEQRGPQCVNGGHTLMAQATVIAIARKTRQRHRRAGSAFSPNNAARRSARHHRAHPGVVCRRSMKRIAEQLITTGFKNVVLMGDHGGGQEQLGEVAKKLGREICG